MVLRPMEAGAEPTPHRAAQALGAALNPCKPVCVPREENFYYRHWTAVVDGTLCYAGHRDICVEGVCRCWVTCGEGQQEWEVVCIGDGGGGHLPDHHCSSLACPVNTRMCWRPAYQLVLHIHTNDWTLYTCSCGTGTQVCQVVCMDQDQNPYEGERCSEHTKPHTAVSCNTQPCPGAQMVPSVQDPRDHESSLRGFVPYGHGEPSGTAAVWMV
ncbi:LOW QUALITY PROTEIN: papilin b, proteoglycan-like sulfated glycoprotein [Electrophorus electricus]|uniref:LOW QUALITY PROTEIN: papilin b, proteoglycan-like sulfated glycoprotein n=1 Tax=Electrophorus electricus TaxID=8005 RepID=UPI0015D09F71|nr:LOW QUALITY PROTEIN: papilin b, proteoglycan-like sulfated glycoprotein [Electrophorus electricus]